MKYNINLDIQEQTAIVEVKDTTNQLTITLTVVPINKVDDSITQLIDLAKGIIKGMN